LSNFLVNGTYQNFLPSRAVLFTTEPYMSFRNLSIFTVIALTSTPALVAQAASPKAEIQGTYNKIAAAFARKDINAATSYFTDDYVNTSAQGTTRTAAELRDYYKPLLRPVKVNSSRISIQSFSADGNQAQVVAKQISKMTLGSKKVVSESTSRDTWVRTSAGWRIQQSTELSVNNTIDGQPVQ
jgi:ketosteroid isomerase-like protein